MMPISPTPHDDQETIKEICNQKEWSAHQSGWSQALVAYAAQGGNPWHISPAVFSADIKKELIKLYENRKGYGYIKKIRDYPFTGCCPVCGSLGTGTVDHYLPKDKYPEFSIYSLNLIPACTYCNTHEKGEKYIGTQNPDRFIHPYFDNFTNKSILSVELLKPYDAVTINPVPDKGISGEELSIVIFHLTETLGEAFKKYTTNLWNKLPPTIALQLKETHREIKPDDARTQIHTLMLLNQATYGINSWPTGFYRGVLADPEVINYMAQKATSMLA